MKRIESVALAVVDSAFLPDTIRALKRCMQICEFEGVLLLSDSESVSGLRMPTGVRHVPIPAVTSLRQYSDFVVRDMHRFVAGSSTHVLIIQHDGFVTCPEAWDRRFLQYDYIGAPWPDGVVGNGGFSMRSRRLMQLVSQVVGRVALHPEDEFICRSVRGHLEREGLKFAPADVARRFSVETGPWAPAFGFHGPHMDRTAGLSSRMLPHDAADLWNVVVFSRLVRREILVAVQLLGKKYLKAAYFTGGTAPEIELLVRSEFGCCVNGGGSFQAKPTELLRMVDGPSGVSSMDTVGPSTVVYLDGGSREWTTTMVRKLAHRGVGFIVVDVLPELRGREAVSGSGVASEVLNLLVRESVALSLFDPTLTGPGHPAGAEPP